QSLLLPKPLGSYVMENVLFKISYPAEFHAQTAVEAAMTLHPKVRDRLADIESLGVETQKTRGASTPRPAPPRTRSPPARGSMTFGPGCRCARTRSSPRSTTPPTSATSATRSRCS